MRIRRFCAFNWFQVALTALREDRTMAEFCKGLEPHTTQINAWKRLLLYRRTNDFGAGGPRAIRAGPAARQGLDTTYIPNRPGSFCLTPVIEVIEQVTPASGRPRLSTPTRTASSRRYVSV